jgi:Fe2+ or Zn2+ uptake regulation protein
MVCGGVEDFEAPEEFEAGINKLVETAAQRGFVVDGHLFDMIGRCAACS